MMVTDDIFKYDDQVIVEECFNMLFASTQTTTLLMQNAIYYLTANQTVLQKLRYEVKKEFIIEHPD
jgi:cytochrome P450